MSYDTPFEFRDMTGQVRKVGLKAPTEDHRRCRAAQTNIAQWRVGIPGEPVVYNRKEIRQKLIECGGEFGFSSPFSIREDQGSENACTAASAVAALRAKLLLDGKDAPDFSWHYLYDLINDHRDEGAPIPAAIEALKRYGVPLMSDYPQTRLRTPPVLQKVWRESLTVTVSTAEQVATAILTDIPTQFGMWVGPDLERFSPGGIGYGGRVLRGWGNWPNHSVHGTKLKLIEDKICVEVPQTWGAWGPRRDGIFYLTLDQIDATSQADNGYAHAAVSEPGGQTGKGG